MGNTVLFYDETAADREMVRLEAAARSLTSTLEVLHQHGVSLASSSDVVKAEAVQDAIRARVAAFPACIGDGYTAQIIAEYRAAISRYSAANLPLSSFTFEGRKVRVSNGTKQRIKAKYTVFATDGQEALLARLQRVADDINSIAVILRHSHTAFSVVGARPNVIEIRNGKAQVNKQALQFIKVVMGSEEEKREMMEEFPFLTED